MRRVRVAGVRIGFTLLVLPLIAPSAAAGVVTQHYDFARPEVAAVGAYQRVTMDGAWSYGDPGKPALPIFGARILLPPGEVAADVTVVPGDRVVLGRGFVVEPGQRQYPLSYDGPVERTAPRYEDLGLYPPERSGKPVTGYFRGHGIVNVPLNPVEFDPATGEIAYYRSMDVEIRTGPDRDVMRSESAMVRNDASTVTRLSRLVDNPDTRGVYRSVTRMRPAGRLLDPALAYKYIIITTDSWDDYLSPLVDFETQRGHKAAIFLRSWIVANYPGADDQAKIRNFIIDAYGTWDIDYVLLAGDARDASGIPHRGMWNDAYGEVDYDIPCDLYYGGLDGSWNSDGDDKWGEYSPEEADLYAEVGVGRVCIDSASAAQNFVAKTERYLDSPIVSECDEALMVGELLWTSPLTYGGTYKDQVMNGSSANGYTTVGFGPAMNVDTLYDRDVTWSASTLIGRMESGLNIVNHLGHCNVQYAMKMYNSDISSFDNDGTVHSLNFVYSQGCYCGAFDDRDPDMYVGDCFAEEFVNDDDGAVAVIMNSRYGWGDPGGTNGSSQYFDREFFDALFGEGIYPVADANDDSKADAVWAINYGANRWVHYEATTFGDPALELWTASPTALTVDYPASIMVGQPDMNVTVSSGGSPVSGARVTVWTDGYSVYDTELTSGAGTATVHPYATETGTLHIEVHAPDHLTWTGDAIVQPAQGPYVTFDSRIIDDDQNGQSAGNGDSIVNAGETIELLVALKNVGVDTAYDVSATLSSESEHVTLIDADEEYGDIAAGSTAQCLDDYELAIAPSAGDGELIPLTLTVSDAGRATWISNISLVVSAPSVAYESHTALDPPYGGNGSGCVEAGETIVIGLSLANSGSAAATGLSARLSTADPYAVIHDDVGEIEALSPGSSEAVSPEYVVSIQPDCPDFHEIAFDVDVTADWGYGATVHFSVLTAGGPLADDVESGEGDWTHVNASPGFSDEWHIDTYRYHSSGHSWKCGSGGSGYYDDSLDATLVMRPMCIGSNGLLTFWHWMSAEEESSTSAWDCGLVEISTDGGSSWSTLVPDGGYSHTKNSNPANPLPEGTPCWSGSISWREESFDLAAYAGETVQVRFRFASDGYVTYEGWYIDDVSLSFDSGGTSGVAASEVPLRFALLQNAPNPFNPVTVIQYELPEPARVRIDVFNVAGKLVRTIVDEPEKAGSRSVTWDGTDEGGRKVASGVYLYRLTAGGRVSQKRMVLLK